jgi:hypothetical protein
MLISLLFNSHKDLKGYLEGIKTNKPVKYRYIFFGEKDPESIRLLQKRNFQEVVHSLCDELYRNRFLREYIDLVGSLGEEHHSIRWWATDMASKNRFTSRLPVLLHQFLTIIEAIEKKDFDHLIVLNPSWVILDSLRRVLEDDHLKYVCIGNFQTKWKEIGKSWSRRFLAVVYNMLRASFRKYYTQRKLKQRIGDSRSCAKPFYVVKTFIYDHSFSKNAGYQDVFFGSLPEYVKKSQPLLIYANILGRYKYCVNRIAECSSHIILPIEAFLPYGDIIKGLVEALFCRIRFKNEVLFFGYDVTDIINNELFRVQNGIPYYQFLHYGSTQRLLQDLTVGTFVLTYENNPWEKMCIMALREYSPQTRIIGYQHTVVPQASANMFISQKEMGIIPIPDRILTVGEVPKEIMERYGSYEEGMIGTSCGLRFEYLSHLALSERKRSGHILVALEGIVEVYKLVNYILRELKESEQHQVIIRTHPVLPLKHFAHKLIHPLEEIKNFSISANSLKDDIEWADMVIYWGSTVALEALSMGKPVINFEMGSVLSYDPLFECRHLKWVVSEKDPLKNTINEIYSMADDQFISEQMKAKAYLNRYFFPVTEERLSKFLT